MVSEVTRDSEPESDLNHEDLSTKFEDEPREAVRVTVRPLKKELARLRDSEKYLKNEVFSRMLEAEPNEALKPLAKPLV